MRVCVHVVVLTAVPCAPERDCCRCVFFRAKTHAEMPFSSLLRDGCCVLYVCMYIYIYSKSSAQKNASTNTSKFIYVCVCVPQRRRIMVENLKTRRRKKKKKRINVRISVYIGRVRRQNGNEFVQTGAKFLSAYRHPRRELSAW